MKLICGPNSSCPEGYTCVAGTCWRPAEAEVATRLAGRWVFGANAKQKVTCSDGSHDDTDLQGPDGFIDLTLGTSSPLFSYYFCPWKLDVSGSSTAIETGQSCSAPDMVNPSITYTWHGDQLTLTSSDGKNGSLSASFPYDYVIAPATTIGGNCMMHINADLTKQ